MHLIGIDDPLARNDVVIDGIEGRGYAALEAALDPLTAADPEVHHPLDQPPSRRSEKPEAFRGLLRQRPVHLIRRRLVNALKVEGAVDDGADAAALLLDARDLRLKLVERLAPALRRALD